MIEEFKASKFLKDFLKIVKGLSADLSEILVKKEFIDSLVKNSSGLKDERNFWEDSEDFPQDREKH